MTNIRLLVSRNKREGWYQFKGLRGKFYRGSIVDSLRHSHKH